MEHLLSRLSLSLWGKAKGLDEPYSLVRHLLDTAALLEVLWDYYLDGNQRRVIARGLDADLGHARATVVFWGALHDIGKLAVGFQSCDRAALALLDPVLVADVGAAADSRIDHARAGMLAVTTLLSGMGFEDDAPDSPLSRVAEIIGGHHGRFRPVDDQWFGNPAFNSCLGGPSWDEQRQLHVSALHSLLGAPKAPKACSTPAAVLITGLVILADWLVSQEDYLRERQSSLSPDLHEHLARARSAALPLLDEAGLRPVRLASPDFAQAHGLATPNPLQRSIVEDLPSQVTAGEAGILVVAAATGDGKTEAGLEGWRTLSAASGSAGLGYFLPTMATSDQLHQRISGYVERCLHESDRSAGAVALTHSMAWLGPAYADDAAVLTGEDPGTATAKRMAPRRWLRGLKRALLAQFAVGTVDQALLGVLPVAHNALRMLGLSGKTVIIDEAHAYDPYMQVLLGRLLHWLGAYGCPVVLLSATLPRSVSDALIKEYLTGAGLAGPAVRERSFTVPYPGWLYVSATGEASQINENRHREQVEARHSALVVESRPVRHTSPGGAEGGDTRAAVLLDALDPVWGADGGCAVVACNTVPDAQATYRLLCAEAQRRGLASGAVELLHARFPGVERQARAARIGAALGRSGPRPHRRIVVATQVLEVALDLDADLIVSDLAPLAQLLQRAGRCWRHQQWWTAHGFPNGRGRPAWSSGPRLVVLDPLGSGGVPRHWGGDDGVYPAFLLEATARLLTGLGETPIRIPQEVPAMVEAVHGVDDRFDWAQPDASASYSAFMGNVLAERAFGKNIVIPRCESVYELADLHRLPVDEEQAATRLGADSIRVLCLFEHSDGTVSLDADRSHSLSDVVLHGSPTVAATRTIMGHTIPVRSDWLGTLGDTERPPSAWNDHTLLGDLAVLRHQVIDGAARPVRLARGDFHLDPDLGLVRD
ncbi:CRISPR-associated endonuclease Cas3'' [Glycomyces harbinensis]|uniref:CRISPR-associated endonuclease/helicase Cas3 n=1 Tax=Glycomyces harbinensis TaxID=58114 RepID=A0A1G6YDM1_9ACTN|nr:CRISPR-associated endonuclease Cas3'' [Glycomyces harbinensis]SDD87817.1 CRISPR-associated endonuclease/helicase Cas3 [Glycomyces harbinensis]